MNQVNVSTSEQKRKLVCQLMLGSKKVALVEKKSRNNFCCMHK